MHMQVTMSIGALIALIICPTYLSAVIFFCAGARCRKRLLKQMYQALDYEIEREDDEE